jgi:F0F1-type ATP synthase assembly protein I
MAINQILYKNKKSLSFISAVLVVLGAILSYIYYGTEPWETVGGFICGIGFGLFIIFISLKQPQNPS